MFAAQSSSHAGQYVYDQAPMLVYWESTRACDLACIHCRAAAVAQRHPLEMNTREAMQLMDAIAAFGGPHLPHLVITGGDPLQRPDLFTLIEYARSLGIRLSVTPAGTARIDGDVIRQLKAAGVSSLALSLDGAAAATHDAFRGVNGSFQWTMEAAHTICAEEIPLQVNTMVCAQTIAELPAIYERMKSLPIERWALFFLIPTGRGESMQEITAAESETLMQWVADLTLTGDAPFAIKTTEAHHYRRILLQQMPRAHRAPQPAAQSGAQPDAQSERRQGAMRRGFGIRDGNGIIFVSHVGDVFPSGFMPLSLGNVRQMSLVDIYRDHAVLQQLREPDMYVGKCGYCEFRRVCGGSRARALAVTGNPLESDPLCTYVPKLHAQNDETLGNDYT